MPTPTMDFEVYLNTNAAAAPAVQVPDTTNLSTVTGIRARVTGV